MVDGLLYNFQGLRYKCLLLLCCAASGCDAVSNYEGTQVIATQKMHLKIHKTKAALQQYTDTLIYREARRMLDSIKGF